MRKSQRRGMSSVLRGKLVTAYKAIVAAKDHASGAAWSILHRVESELARALHRRNKITHEKTAKRK